MFTIKPRDNIQNDALFDVITISENNMLLEYFNLYLLLICCYVSISYAKMKRQNSGGDITENDNAMETDDNKDLKDDDEHDNSAQQCWLRLNTKNYYEYMDNLDDRYAEVRANYQKAVESDNFDKEMLEMMIQTRGAAARNLEKESNYFFYYRPIPAGFNLANHCMMRMPNCILFFNRIKLRNDTHFRVNFLHNDLMNMTLSTHISLNDLHLIGSYERATTDIDPSVLFYQPTFGEMEILLKDVVYKMEGRYRLLKDNLYIELIVSNIVSKDILMTYVNSNINDNRTPATQKKLKERNIEELLDRIKTNLDDWLKDYFNDYLMYFGLSGRAANTKFQEYDQKKIIASNNFMDSSLKILKQRLHNLQAANIMTPDFTFYTVTGTEINLKDGVLRGLDTMYRRSVTTCKTTKTNRHVDANIGFSNLKMTYKYEALVTTGVPPVSGILILTADDTITHLELQLVKAPEAVDATFKYIRHLKPGVLTVEGPGNRLIANFKRLLEQHILSLMTNTVIYYINQLSELSRCAPNLNGHVEPDENVAIEKKINNRISDDINYKTSSKGPNSDRETNSDDSDVKRKVENNKNSNLNVTDEIKDRTEHSSIENETQEVSINNSKKIKPQKKNHSENEMKSDTPDYVITKDESIELELDPNSEEQKNKQKMLVQHKERFSIKKINKE